MTTSYYIIFYAPIIQIEKKIEEEKAEYFSGYIKLKENVPSKNLF